METKPLITELPEGYREEKIDADIWIDHFKQMMKDLVAGEPVIYSVAGIDMGGFLLNRDAYKYLAIQNGVTIKFGRCMQVMSHEGLQRSDNVAILNSANLPSSFAELTLGARVIPMDESWDAISDDYDGGYPIWICTMRIVKFKP